MAGCVGAGFWISVRGMPSSLPIARLSDIALMIMTSLGENSGTILLRWLMVIQVGVGHNLDECRAFRRKCCLECVRQLGLRFDSNTSAAADVGVFREARVVQRCLPDFPAARSLFFRDLTELFVVQQDMRHIHVCDHRRPWCTVRHGSHHGPC